MNLLGLFVKHPVVGQVKTRLAASLGEEQATNLYAAFSADLIERFREFGERRVLCYAPDNAAASDYFGNLANGAYELWPQPDGSIGNRMETFFCHFLRDDVDRAVVIGSDSPTLPSDLVKRAFELLKTHGYVLGPACDGGFYLVGQQKGRLSLFDDIRWSSSQTMSQVVARIAETGGQLGLLPPWYDIDTVDDLEMLYGHVQALRLSGSTLSLEKTEPLLQQHKVFSENPPSKQYEGRQGEQGG